MGFPHSESLSKKFVT